MNKFVTYIILAVAIFFGGYFFRGKQIVVKSETITVYDTINDNNPQPQITPTKDYKTEYLTTLSKLKQKDYVIDSLINRKPFIIYDTITDSIIVAIPMDEFRLQAENYDIKGSGYNTKFDYIKTFNTTITKREEFIDPRKFTLSAYFDYSSNFKIDSKAIGVELSMQIFRNTFISAYAQYGIFNEINAPEIGATLTYNITKF